MAFPDWWMGAFLTSMGWPRSEGFLGRRRVVSSQVADMAMRQLGHMGMVLGADAPDVGMKLLRGCFERNWETEGVADLAESLDGKVDSGVWDWPNEYQTLGDKLPAEFLGGQLPTVQMRFTFACGVWLGLTAPKRARDTLDEYFAGISKYLPEMRAAELEVQNQVMDRGVQLASSLETVDLYERTRQTPPEIPTALVQLVSMRRGTDP